MADTQRRLTFNAGTADSGGYPTDYPDLMRFRPRLEKTVYVLGAGFSVPAGGPNQALLMKEIFALPDSTKRVCDAKVSVRDLLVNVLSMSPNQLNNVSLEDVYTPIDRCLADGVSFKSKNAAELTEIRGHIEYLISLAIDRRFRTTPESRKQYVKDFAKYLVDQVSIRSQKARGAADASAAKAYDPLAVISLNWDILLDNALYEALGEKDDWKTGDYDPIGVVDYCCYISSIDSGAKRIRSGLWTLGTRGYNLKLLKIHGSMNWLQCLNCQRLFVAFDKKVNIPNYINARTCRHCRTFGVTATLQGTMIMPTFLKDLTNFQIKLVWQNAGVELMEASKIVFVGYSLPHSDFEFRQLLSRMVNTRARIHVVLRNTGTEEGTRHYNEGCERYKQFFGTRDITFEAGGVTAFVEKLTEENSRPPKKIKIRTSPRATR